MRLLFLMFLILVLTVNSSCDDDGKKINGDILVTIGDEETLFPSIYRMTEDEVLTKLGPFDDYGSDMARWSVDGKHIVFQTGKKSTTSGPSLYVMKSDGSGAKPLKEVDIGFGLTSTLKGFNATWSPDGKKIAYDYCDCEVNYNSEVYVIDLKTKNVTNITNNSYGDAGPIWSPDGLKIIFLSNRDNDAGLYLVNSDGSNPNKITRGTLQAWSNTDSLISYFYDDSLSIFNINAMTVDRRISIHIDNEVPTTTMTWAPDNRNILFLTYSADGLAKRRLYRLNLEDQSITRLLETYNHVSSVDWLKQ